MTSGFHGRPAQAPRARRDRAPRNTGRRPGACGRSWRAALTLSAALGACLATLAAPAAQAQSADLVDLERSWVTLGEHTIIALPGSFRFVGGHVDPIRVHSPSGKLPDAIDPDDFADFRLRFSPSLTFTGTQWPLFQVYQVVLDAQLALQIYDPDLDEQLAYDPVQRLRSAGPAPDLMQAYVLAAGKHMAVRAGLVRSSWGAGILANDGEDRGFNADDGAFGFARSADRVLRLQLAWFPIQPERRAAEGAEREPPPLTVAVAGDMVMDDDTANWGDGDRAFNGVAAVIGRYEGFDGGLYAVYRNQRHHEGGTTSVAVFDVQARQEFAHTDTLTAWAQVEAAIVVGSSSYAQNPTKPGDFDIVTTGGVVKLGVDVADFMGVMEVGAASGDDNPFDTKLRGFSFDREYRVGLLMFGEYMRRHTAIAAFNIADDTYRAVPPRGYERAATGGVVNGAIYVNPRVSYEIIEGLSVMAGYLYGSSEGYYTDPFATGLAGGTSAGPGGALNAKELGHELDLGVDFELEFQPLTLRTRAEFAWFRPGAVFATSSGRPSDVVGFWLHAEAAW